MYARLQLNVNLVFYLEYVEYYSVLWNKHVYLMYIYSSQMALHIDESMNIHECV